MKRILVLDDDEDNLEILSFILKESGHDVRTAVRGDTVFEEIDAYQPHLLLMDVRLAGLDGREICRNIKEDPLTALLPIILISGIHDLSNAMLQPGAPNDYIVKPYDLKHLRNSVEQQLTGPA
jgi:DNA-binding response OmpR family regulator